MKKIKYRIWYQVLKLRAKVMKLILKHIGKDYFIFGSNIVELKWLYTKYCFSYRSTVMLISGTKFLINWETVIDIDNWLKVLFHWVSVRPNVAWYIINNKQYDAKLNLIDDGEIHSVMYNILVTEHKQNWWIMYKIMNLKWEELYTMFSDVDKLTSTVEWDFITYKLGNHTKEIHIMWIKETI